MDLVREIPFLACVEFSRRVCSVGKFESYPGISLLCAESCQTRLRTSSCRWAWQLAVAYPLGMESGRGASCCSLSPVPEPWRSVGTFPPTRKLPVGDHPHHIGIEFETLGV